ncbi:MAG: histidine decarboxylase [Alphaproteobacteria bacterium CG_4_9_14_3_um_filter_47_13]|nr:MAG: histidine decarboxylase [Alphaproteobacteria bacterium CG_4_9_14_3_um_filter_47_13]
MNITLKNKDRNRLDEMLARITDDSAHMLGYPATKTLDFSVLYPFLEVLINNIGDPFALAGCFRLNTHDIECEVVKWFSKILHANEKDVWGYVTSGGTEGNMYGLYLARELFPNGMVYYSEDTHYSVTKILRMVNARSIMIKSRSDGEIDYDDLAATIAIHRDVPPVIFANIGTTMKGAIDNLDSIKTILKDKAVTRYYIHADAALSGMILPFTDNPQPFDFADEIDSISISGHKFPGCPMPCGVVLAKRDLVNRVARSVEYIGTNDTTVLGSRNGVTPLFLWYAIHALGENGFRDMVQRCFTVVDYTIEKFAAKNIQAWRHKNSVTVVFPRINEPILQKWQIAVQGDNAHLIAMPHITKERVDEFIKELTA